MPSRSVWLAAAAVLLLTVLTFASVHSFGFVNYDDFEFIVDNPHVVGGLTLENVRWAWQHPYTATGGPLTWLSHMLDVELFGVTPAGPHVVNLALHMSSTLLLLLVLYWLTGEVWRSAFVAALFAVHPLHVESVAWISERKDVLSAFFWFAAIGAYGWYVRRPGVVRYTLIAVCLTLGLMSKPMVATLPFLLLLLDFWPLRRLRIDRSAFRKFSRLVLEKAPLMALSAIAMWMTLRAQEQIGAVSNTLILPLSDRFANAVVSYGQYLRQTIWPAGLVPYYSYRTDISAVSLSACLVLLILLTAGAFAVLRRAPAVTVGWCWYLGTLAPVIGLVQVGGHARADRFTYLPLTGIFIAIAWGVPPLFARFRQAPRVLSATALVIVIILAAAAHAQSLHWRDGLSLWEHTVRVDPASARAYSNLGVVLAEGGRQDEAIRAYNTALRLQPGVAQTHHNLALALEAVGRRDEAVEHHTEAVRLKPDYAKARMHLANLLAQSGQTSAAIDQYVEAIRLDPDNALIHVNLAVTLGRGGRPAEAVTHMREAIRLQPRNAQWRYFTGLMLMEAGRTSEAEKMMEETLAIDPQHAGARAALDQIRR